MNYTQAAAMHKEIVTFLNDNDLMKPAYKNVYGAIGNMLNRSASIENGIITTGPRDSLVASSITARDITLANLSETVRRVTKEEIAKSVRHNGLLKRVDDDDDDLTSTGLTD
jgi:replicative DNA helicase